MHTNRGKELRVIIVGNIANYAYELGSILNKNGVTCYVLADGITHVMSQPEWLLTISYLPSANESFDDWDSVNLIKSTPNSAVSRWYIRGSSIYSSLLALLIQDKLLIPARMTLGIINTSDTWARRVKIGIGYACKSGHCFNGMISAIYRFGKYVARDSFFQVLKSHLGHRAFFCKCQAKKDIVLGSEDVEITASKNIKISQHKQDAHRSVFILSSTSVLRFLPKFIQSTLKYTFSAMKKLAATAPRISIVTYTQRAIKEHFERHNFCLVGTTVSSDIFRKLGISNYSNICLGTIRGLPFEDSDLGRLTKTVYEGARISMLTNYDCTSQAESLWPNQPERYFWALHPYTRLKPSDFMSLTSIMDILSLYNIDTSRPFFLCPARHQWTQGNSSALKGNDVMIRGIGRFVDTSMSNSSRQKLPIFIFSEWGIDVQASKRLIAELGIQEHIYWIPPLPKRSYVSLIKYSLGVIDQFNAKTFGGVALDTISVGNVLISSVDESSIALKFPQLPTYFSAHDHCQVADQLKKAYKLSTIQRAELKIRQKEWFDRYHSEDLQLHEFISCVAGVPWDNS